MTVLPKIVIGLMGLSCSDEASRPLGNSPLACYFISETSERASQLFVQLSLELRVAGELDDAKATLPGVRRRLVEDRAEALASFVIGLKEHLLLPNVNSPLSIETLARLQAVAVPNQNGGAEVVDVVSVSAHRAFVEDTRVRWESLSTLLEEATMECRKGTRR